MSLFARKNGREKSEQIWVVPEMKNIGKYTADEQRQYIQELNQTRISLTDARLELEALENSFNRQSTELEKLRAAAGDRIGDSLLRAAHERILMLEKLNENKSLRLGVFDDMVSIFKSGRQDYRCADKHPSLTDEIENFLNKA